MPRISDSFDLDRVEWRRVTDLSNPDFKVDFEFSLLGYDMDSQRLDMLLRYGKGGGHCRRHRHDHTTMAAPDYECPAGELVGGPTTMHHLPADTYCLGHTT